MYAKITGKMRWGNSRKADTVGVVMSDKQSEILPDDLAVVDPEARDRRDFLLSLGKWSKVVIGGVALGGALLPAHEARAIGWSNHGNWVNLGGGGPGWGGGGWGWGGWGYGPGWFNGPGWVNGPGWYDRPGWGGPPRWYDGPRWRSWHNRPWRDRDWYNGRW